MRPERGVIERPGTGLKAAREKLATPVSRRDDGLAVRAPAFP
jgi:hypothetical protein